MGKGGGGERMEMKQPKNGTGGQEGREGFCSPRDVAGTKVKQPKDGTVGGGRGGSFDQSVGSLP